MRRASIMIMATLVLAACGESETSDGAPPADSASGDVAADITEDGAVDAVEPGDGETVAEVSPDAAVPLCPEPSDEVVTFMTEDGLTLEADLHTSGVEDAPAVVLLHMIPPVHDRTNYPLEFRELLVEQGFTVLNVDRRGAGGSEGEATEAHQGPQGKLDAAAAVAYLSTLPCPPDPARLGLVGASNGTTTAVDYTIDHAANATGSGPKALVFLTGGTYTENQNVLSDHLEVLEPLPILFVYPADEATWSATYEGASSQWTHAEYEASGHGTLLFDAAPASMDEVASWLAERL